MALEDLQAMINKKLTNVTIKKASDKDLANTGELVDHISTGSSVLDYYVIGQGGIPVPRISIFSGPFSSGKSTFSQNVIKHAQEKGYITFLIEIEKAFDRKRLEYIGVDTDKLQVVSIDTEEDRFTVESLFELIETILTTTKEPTFIVVDSISALQSIAEVDTSMMHNASMASTARAIKKGMKKINDLLPDSNSAVLFITAVYANISGYGDKFIEYGGSGINYYASTMTRFTIKKKEKEEKYQLVTAKNIKNKVSTPFREGGVYLSYSGKILDSYAILDIAAKYKLLKRSGAWYSYKDVKFQKKTLANSEIYEDLRNEVINIMKAEVAQYAGDSNK